jgi:hypothetical protein
MLKITVNSLHNVALKEPKAVLCVLSYDITGPKVIVNIRQKLEGDQGSPGVNHAKIKTSFQLDRPEFTVPKGNVKPVDMLLNYCEEAIISALLASKPANIESVERV